MKLSLVIPTFNEKENIQKLLVKLEEVFRMNEINNEIIVVDDNSPDGTGLLLEGLKSKYSNLKVVHRTGKLGLSSAVFAGIKVSEGDILGVMDADLSHPAEKIIDMYNAVLKGACLVVGSRYIKGGQIKGWGLRRKILSKGATLLARVFTKVKDPMSGYFMIRKSLLEGKDLNSRGFKILLELLIKIEGLNVVEVPICFTDRTHGKSKAGVKEIVLYLRNLIGYLPQKKHLFTQLFKFALVGIGGTFVNVFILYVMTERFGVYYLLSAIFSFLLAVVFNFILNKTWTFKEKVHTQAVNKFGKFFFVSLFALLINIIILYVFTDFFGVYYIYSQIVAIGFSFAINFLGNKIWTF